MKCGALGGGAFESAIIRKTTNQTKETNNMSAAKVTQPLFDSVGESFVPRIRNRAKTAVLGIVCSMLFASMAFAADSVCTLGDNGKIALSTFEHRSDTGNGRVTEVTLIFGMHLLRGKLVDVDSGPVTLKETGSSKYNYKFGGTIGVDYKIGKMMVKGKITDGTGTEISNINSTFRAKELNP
jgi:hypothetical protein